MLIVDEDPRAGEILSERLIARGFEVSTAADAAGARAVAAASPGSIDVVVADLVLEDGNGIEVAGEVRRTSPDVRVLLTSALVKDPADVSHLLEEGMVFVAPNAGPDGVVLAVERAARLSWT